MAGVNSIPISFPAFLSQIFLKSGSDFIPIDALFRQDADTHLSFLSGNDVLYLETSTDDWYRIAKEPTNVTWVGANEEMNTQVYLPTEPASPVGCADQYQFCNTGIKGNGRCGPLSSLRDALAGAPLLFNTSYAEFSTYEAESEPGLLLAYFGNVFFSFDITVESILGQLGGHGLLSHRTLSAAYQESMAARFHANIMAFIGTAVGPTDDSLFSLRTDYATPKSNKLCNSRKIRSTAYGSFSLFGLFFILIFGMVLALISYLLQLVSEFLCKRKGYKAFAHLEWTTNGALQLQRLAHEEIGMGTWKKCLDTIPATRKGELLGSLDTTDLEHPVHRPCIQKVAATLDKAQSFGETDTLNTQASGTVSPSAANQLPPEERTSREEQALKPILRKEKSLSSNSHKT
ncbi:hypothetical protein RRF57_011350 [Xylaria bambusicola]|uniref:Uncharacterized protein n=1 Tax=Xylaria bambusicola TaxID=326684 RepID=A0AAN7UUR6_9PEZI